MLQSAGETDLAMRESGATMALAAGMSTDTEPLVKHRCRRDGGVGKGKGKQAPRRVNVPAFCLYTLRVETSSSRWLVQVGLHAHGEIRCRSGECMRWGHAVATPRVCRTTSPRAPAGMSCTCAGTTTVHAKGGRVSHVVLDCMWANRLDLAFAKGRCRTTMGKSASVDRALLSQSSAFLAVFLPA